MSLTLYDPTELHLSLSCMMQLLDISRAQVESVIVQLIISVIQTANHSFILCISGSN